MRLRDLDPEAIESIEFHGREYRHHGDHFHFRITHPDLEIKPMLNGNYFGVNLLVTMRPPTSRSHRLDKSASSAGAF